VNSGEDKGTLIKGGVKENSGKGTKKISDYTQRKKSNQRISKEKRKKELTKKDKGEGSPKERKFPSSIRHPRRKKLETDGRGSVTEKGVPPPLGLQESELQKTLPTGPARRLFVLKPYTDRDMTFK